jgi:hypothetical protein
MSCEKKWYNTEEVAQALGKSYFAVRKKWCNRGRLVAAAGMVSP